QRLDYIIAVSHKVRQAANLAIPLPPLSEQRRIADILDKADALRAKRRAALAHLETLTQSIFLDMFGDPAINPKGWSTALLKESTAKIQIGPFGSLLHQGDYVAGGIPLVNPKHLQHGTIQPDPSETVSAQKFAELGTYHLRAGDVVMGRRGEMGRCAIVYADSGPLLCGTGALFVRPDNKHMTSLFLFFVLSSSAVKARLERASLGQTLPNLNSQIVEVLEVPSPPLTVQIEFAARVESAYRVARAQSQAANQLNSVFASLQQRAFRGEL
ncbi:MAG: restriction endonuclease subunit S, partial [Candidatus Tectomicrobia bacterium]|nr:restriction endonuclease subunit S [Candidatus Tectomicrobia bacterium]